MKLFPIQQLSDDEVVERARKQLNMGHRFRWFWLVLSVAWLGLAMWWLSFAFDWVETFTRGSAVQWHWFILGMSTGLSAGSFGILLLGKAFLSFYFFLDPLMLNRRDQLLVQFYDQLHPNP